MISYREVCWNVKNNDLYLLNTSIIKKLKDVDAVILLMVLQYKERLLFYSKSLSEDNWFWFTRDDIQKETFLSSHRQRKAIKKLIKHNLIEHELRTIKQNKRGYNSKIPYFKIDYKTMVKTFFHPLKNLTHINIYNNIDSSKDNKLSLSRINSDSDESLLTSFFQGKIKKRKKQNVIKGISKREHLTKMVEARTREEELKAKLKKKDKREKSQSKPILRMSEQVKLIWDAWEAAGLKLTKKERSVSRYNRTIRLCNDLLEGKVPGLTSPPSIEKIIDAINRFSLAALSNDYRPVEKKYLKAMGLIDFIFRQYKPEESRVPSQLKYYLENKEEPYPLFKRVEDKYPTATKEMIDFYQTRAFGKIKRDLSADKIDKFRRGANLLMTLWDKEIRSRTFVSVDPVEEFCSSVWDGCGHDLKKFHPGNFCSQTAYENFIKHLNQEGIIEDYYPDMEIDGTRYRAANTKEVKTDCEQGMTSDDLEKRRMRNIGAVV